MHFDTIIIGGGIAGLTAAIRCCELGQKTALISAGQSSMHFSSGALDVLARLPNGDPISQPFVGCENLKQLSTTHPYAKVGTQNIQCSLQWFEQQLKTEGITFTKREDDQNMLRLTPLGGIRPTYLKSEYSAVFSETKNIPEHILLINILGYRDFQPSLTQHNLQKHPLFEHCKIEQATIDIPELSKATESRSMDLAHLFQQEKTLQLVAKQLIKHGQNCDTIIMPSVFDSNDTLTKLRMITQLDICEIACMPPSMMGIRIEHAMLRRFRKLGGVHLPGDEVQKGEFDGQKLTMITTRNHDIPFRADNFVLATGSYFSRGLTAERDGIIEPIFGLKVSKYNSETSFKSSLFTKQLQPFMQAGLITNQQLNPLRNDLTVTNIYCAGSVLSGYDPVFEGSGSGVAISTGFQAANLINARVNIKLDNQITGTD